MKAYPESIIEQYSRGNIIQDLIETILFCTKDETRNMVFKLFVETNPKCLENRDVWFFHDAFRKCNTEVLKLMIQTNPSYLYQHDPNYPLTSLPIHKGCWMGNCKKIDMLLAFD